MVRCAVEWGRILVPCPNAKSWIFQSWISPPTKQVRVRLEETSRKFLAGRETRCSMRRKVLVVAAVWVYRGSVVRGVQGELA